MMNIINVPKSTGETAVGQRTANFWIRNVIVLLDISLSINFGYQSIRTLCNSIKLNQNRKNHRGTDFFSIFFSLNQIFNLWGGL